MGFIAQGLFQSEEEIANSATMPDRPAYPGYIKYMDRNGDGIITVNQDQGYVGKSSRPTHTGSFNLLTGKDSILIFWHHGGLAAMLH